MHERSAPRVADDLRADHDVSERTRHTLGDLLPPVEREREDIRRLVDAEVITLQRTDLLRAGEREAGLTPSIPSAPSTRRASSTAAASSTVGAAPILDLHATTSTACGRAGLFGVLLVRLDDPLDELCRTTSGG